MQAHCSRDGLELRIRDVVRFSEQGCPGHVSHVVEALGECRVGSVKLELVKRILSCIETFSTDNNNLSWHVHVSGFDKSGRPFWMPIHKDDTVCDSPAAHVLGMVYRFAESGTCMQALAPSILAGSAGAALDSLLPTLRADHDGGSLIDGPLPVCDSDCLVLSRLQSAPRAATVRGAGPLLPPGAERPHFFQVLLVSPRIPNC